MKRKVLIDLMMVKDPNCGLGQVAMNFGREISKIDDPEIEWTFLTKKQEHISHFGDITIRQQSLNLLTKYSFIPVDKGYDLFHIAHQKPRYKALGSDVNILTIHDLNFLGEKTPRKAKKYLRQVQGHVNRASVITCISEFTASEVRKHLSFPESVPIKVIYNGVETPNSEIAQKPDFLPEGDFIFTIGALMAKKNFHVLVDMLKYLPDLKLIIAGPKSEPYHSKILERVKSNNLENRVVISGAISEEEKAYLYHNCRAFVFPTKLEGFGIPIIEAMRCGKPTFASNLTSLPEVGKQHAYYWESFEPENMANVFKEGMKDFKENKQERIEAMKAHGNSFSWTENAKSYHQLYRKILGLD